MFAGGADPQTKGRIENVIGYLKNNFARGRRVVDIESFNEECLNWLQRTGNGKVHQTIKKVPAQVFENEKQYLKRYQNYKIVEPIIPYHVNKDNTITLKSNRYEVPKGTFKKTKVVGVQIDNEKVIIRNLNTHEILQIHPLSKNKGELIKISKASRKKISPAVLKIYKQASVYLGKDSKPFLDQILENYPRYQKDQLIRLLQIAQEWNNKELMKQAVKECIEKDYYSAEKFKQIVEAVAYRNQIPPKAPMSLMDYENLGIENVLSKSLGRLELEAEYLLEKKKQEEQERQEIEDRYMQIYRRYFKSEIQIE